MADIEQIIRYKVEGQQELADLKTRLDEIKDTLANFRIAKVDDTGLQKVKFEMQTLRTEISALTGEQRKATQAATDQAREEAKLQAHLGKMEAATRKEIEAETKLYQTRRKNIDAAVQFSQAQLQLGGGSANNVAAGMGKMAIAGQNLNFVIRDSPYFFRNFQLGVLAIGNNIDPLIQSLKAAQTEAKQLGVSMGSLALRFLKGPGGFIVAVSLINAGIQALVFQLSKSSTEADKSDKAAQSLQKSLNSLGLSYREAIDKVREYREEKNKDFYNDLRIEKEKLSLIQKGLIKEPAAGVNVIGGLGPSGGSANRTVEFTPEMAKRLKEINDLLGGSTDPLLQEFTETMNKVSIAVDKGGSAIKQLDLPLNTLKNALGQFEKEFYTARTTNDPFVKLYANRYNTLKSFLDQYTSLLDKAKSDPVGDFINKLKGEKAAFDISVELSKNKESLQQFLKEQISSINVYDKSNLKLKDKTSLYQLLLSLQNELIKNQRELSQAFSSQFSSPEEALKARSGSASTALSSGGILQGRTRRLNEVEAFEKKVSDVRLKYDAMQESKSDDLYVQHAEIRKAAEIGAFKSALDQNLITETQFQDARKYLNEYYDALIIEARIKQYDKEINAIAGVGNALQKAFSKTGDDFIAKLNEAFQVALQISKALNAYNEKQDTSNILGLISSGLGLFGLFHQGGVVGKAHSGMLATDEIPIIAKKGEMIFNESQQRNLFNLINNPPQNSGGSNTTLIVNHTTFLDGKVISKNQYEYLPEQLRRLAREKVLF